MDKDAKLKIEYMPIDKLKPYEKNARKHADMDVDAIAASIEKFGFDDPIGVWSDKNIIVEGHGRLLAAKKLGMKEVPIIRLDHLSDEERRAYALAHNKTAELSSWDLDNMDTEIEELSEMFDFEELGFDVPERNDTEYQRSSSRNITFHENISVIVECSNDEEAEKTFNALSQEGYTCRISTL